jgi:hypothetical protein
MPFRTPAAPEWLLPQWLRLEWRLSHRVIEPVIITPQAARRYAHLSAALLRRGVAACDFWSLNPCHCRPD